jgi:hypothetical protein
MATTTSKHTSLPEAPEQTPPRPPSGRRSIVLGAAAVLAAGAATAALAVATLGSDTRDEPVDHPALDQPRTTPADDGPVENSPGRAPVCGWTSEATEPVFPNNDIGGPPTPESILIFESCDGQLTGTIAWLTPGPDRTPAQGPAALLPEAGGGDSGLVNPWAAGDAAVDQYLSELGPQCAPAEPGPPATC